MSPSSHPSSPTTCLASQQTLALAMASHPRLGASSPAASLPLDALHRIRDMVSAAHLSLSSTVRLVSIRVKTGEAVECIELCYSDGSHRIHGGVGGTWREPLYLQPCEYLTRISGVQVPGRAVRSVRFDTSHGRVIRYAGHLDASQDCGAPFELTAPSGHEILDFTSRSSSIFAALGCLSSLNGPIHSRPCPWTNAVARLLWLHSPHDFACNVHLFPSAHGGIPLFRSKQGAVATDMDRVGTTAGETE